MMIQFKKAKSIAAQFIKMLFPSSKMEAYIFAFYAVAYSALATFISFHYTIIFDDRIPWDAYFSFDNRAIVKTGGGFERHPLSNFFFDVIRKFALFVSSGQYSFSFRLVLSLCSAFATALSMVQIFKYLNTIIRLPNIVSLVLVLFFSLFSTSLLLSFTPETYTYSMLFLLLFNNYAAAVLQNDKKINGAALTVAGVFIGGLTITNIVKIYIPLLFEKKLFWNFKNLRSIFIKAFISASVFIFLYLWRLEFDVQRIFNKTTEQYEKFSTVKVVPAWDMMTSWFFGGTMLFPGFVLRDYHSKAGFEFKALFMDVYTAGMPYLFISVVGILMIWSVFKNLRNKLLLVLVLSFSVDIIIHCFLQFGLRTGYIYGGHYIFVVPLMMGWLFQTNRKSPAVLSLLMIVLIMLTCYLGVNNFFRMGEFFQFLNRYYLV